MDGVQETQPAGVVGYEEPTEEEDIELASHIREWSRHKEHETTILKNDLNPIRKILKEKLKYIKAYVEKYPHKAPINIGPKHTIENITKTQCVFTESTVSSFFKETDVNAYVRDNTVEKQVLYIKKRKRTVDTEQNNN
jgi:hypothetical protein